MFFICSALANCENMVYPSFRSEKYSAGGVRIVALGCISKWNWVESRSDLQIEIISKWMSNWHHSAFKIDIRIDFQIDLRIDAQIAFRIIVQIERQIHNTKFRAAIISENFWWFRHSHFSDLGVRFIGDNNVIINVYYMFLKSQWMRRHWWQQRSQDPRDSKFCLPAKHVHRTQRYLFRSATSQ